MRKCDEKVDGKFIYDFPEELRKILHGKVFEKDQIGQSDSQVFCFEDMVLKIEKRSEESDREHEILKWLQGKIPVPHILYSGRHEGRNFLLMGKVPGNMACSDKHMENPVFLTNLLAKALRMLWSVEISECPSADTLERKLLRAKEAVENDCCDTENVEPETYGENGFKDPAELLEWLETHKPEEDLVFSHGDFCLPNIFFERGEVSGFIDLGRAGIVDTYQDIALCYRSLRDNYMGKYKREEYPDFRPESLFEALRIEPDWEKLKYYMLLDELF